MTDSCSGMFAIMALTVLMLACAGTAARVVDDDGGAGCVNEPASTAVWV